MRYFISILIIISVSLQAQSVKREVRPDGTVEYHNSGGSERKVPAPLPPSRYDTLILEMAQTHGLQYRLLKAVVQVESGYNPRAVSQAGAMGLMQLMPGTAEIYELADPFNPRENLNAGAAHLAMLMKRYRGDVELALAAYHAGSGTVRRYGGVPPIEATVNYVHKVTHLYRGYGLIQQERRKLHKRIDSKGVLHIYSPQ